MLKKSEIIPMHERCLEPCPECPFGGPKVGSKGDPNSPFLIIGESPGKQELEKGLPFVGPSGKLLDTSLYQGEHPKPYFINAMQCFPGYGDDKNDERLKLGVSACRKRVLDEIAKAPRKLILALGTPALWTATGDLNYKITQERGKVFPSGLCGVGILPTVHPAFLMRGGNGASHQQYMRDVKYAIDLVNGAPTKKPPAVDYIVARDERDVHDLAKYFREGLPKGHVIGSDTETTGFSALSDRILCTGFAPYTDEVYVIPDTLTHVQAELYDNECRFLWHNGKFDVQFQWAAGSPKARVDEDTMMLSYAYDEKGGIHDLETVSSDWVGSPNWKAILDSHLRKGDTYEVIPRDVLYHYMALDIGNMLGVYHILRERINRDSALERLYTRTLIPGANFLARVERNGMFVDLERVGENETWYLAEIKKYQQVFIDFSKPFPDSGYTDKLPNSWKQMQRLLYDDLKIKPHKGNRSTGKKFLEKLAPHPAIEALKVSRKVAKEYGTYVKSARENVDKDGAVHSTYALHGTKTGRLASSNPNLQNVPRNPRIRGQYIARPGRRFVEPDLNQAELRVLACLSNDPQLCYIYENAGMSLHDEVRADIWGYPKDYSPAMLREQLSKFGLDESTRWGAKGEDRIIEEQKMRAKAVNFGIVYGRTAPSIAEEFSIQRQEAQGWIDKWFKKFPKAKEFLDKCRSVPEKCQVIVTPFGRKRRFGVVARELLEGMMNEASNFPPQSSASDITMHAGIHLEEYLKDTYDADICNLVHDSILIECPDDDVIAHNVAVDMCAKLESTPKLWGFNRIPFIAEAKMGYRWGSLSKYDHHKVLEAA
jgi:uracil-DNA glycosylase family 4